MVYSIVIAVLTCYLLGNLNGAVCVSTLLSHDDVRNHGSGNAGLTNFIRNYGGASAFLVIAIDAAKAALACLVSGLLLQPYGYYLEGTVLGGVAVMIGHDFPALLGFKGGKGILSGLLIALCIDWRIAVLILVIFAVVYGITMYVSLASVLASIAFGIGFAVLYSHNIYVLVGCTFMSLLCVFMHRANIVRLIKGQESKTNLFKKGKRV